MTICSITQTFPPVMAIGHAGAAVVAATPAPGRAPGFYSFCLELPEMAKAILSRAMVAAKHARRPWQRRRYAEELMVTGLLAVWWAANGPSDE
ncbi:hypothetical protein [Cupriavidus sp. IK-TO18]|jgi:hypothetical protein|uniref:hypothetical protein n=1 Tax=Cupriavidus sp. IK-TO18 TaxID=2782182 RepID=UPI00189B0A5E|nr:hypothetical protein [Cupriavidus sp. IK-TO18]MBF6987709.1 hypothetical protein [Cupriavidus sp. IK-TO18]